MDDLLSKLKDLGLLSYCIECKPAEFNHDTGKCRVHDIYNEDTATRLTRLAVTRFLERRQHATL